MYREMLTLFNVCCDKFLANQKDLITSGVSERCMCGSLMMYFRYELDNTQWHAYHCDIEYNRNYDGQIKTIIDDHYEPIKITCDLIIHSRGENLDLDNLIAIEMKRSNHPDDEKKKDRARLIALTKAKDDPSNIQIHNDVLPEHVCGYVLGVFFEIDSDYKQVCIEFYRNGAHVDQRIIRL